MFDFIWQRGCILLLKRILSRAENSLGVFDTSLVDKIANVARWCRDVETQWHAIHLLGQLSSDVFQSELQASVIFLERMPAGVTTLEATCTTHESICSPPGGCYDKQDTMSSRD